MANWVEQVGRSGVDGIRIAIRKNDRSVALSNWRRSLEAFPVTVVFYRKSTQDFLFTLTVPSESSSLGGRLLMSGTGYGENMLEMLRLSESLCSALQPDQAAVFVDPNCRTRWDGTGERYINLQVAESYFTTFLRDRDAIAYWISESFGFSPGNHIWLKSTVHKGGVWIEVSEANTSALEDLVSRIGAWSNDVSEYLTRTATR